MLEATPDTYGWAKERVLRVLLDPEHGIPAGRTLYQVAQAAGVSYSWAYDTWRDLVALGAFILPRGRRHQEDIRSATIVDPAAAYRYWLRHRPDRIYADYHVVGALGLLQSVEHRGDLEYLATTYLAENMIQGHLFPRRFDLYVRAHQAPAWAALLGTHGFPIDSDAPGRGIIRLITAADALAPDVMPVQPAPLPPAAPVRGIWIARTPLLIVDLMEEGGACGEAARLLMEKTYGTAVLRT